MAEMIMWLIFVLWILAALRVLDFWRVLRGKPKKAEPNCVVAAPPYWTVPRKEREAKE